MYRLCSVLSAHYAVYKVCDVQSVVCAVFFVQIAQHAVCVTWCAGCNVPFPTISVLLSLSLGQVVG